MEKKMAGSFKLRKIQKKFFFKKCAWVPIPGFINWCDLGQVT